MRRMSFSMTEEALLAGRKTVTRRLGWKNLKPGDQLLAVDKAMGLKKGEKSRVLGTVTVVAVRRERLDAIDNEDVLREGFRGMAAHEFVRMFSRAMGCLPSTIVARVEFDFKSGNGIA